MPYRWMKDPKVVLFTPLMLVLLFVIACGGTAATPVVIEKEVVKEVIKEVVVEKEVIKEVPVEVIVEKEVIKEVVREVVVTPTAVPTPKASFVGVARPPWVDRGKYGTFIQFVGRNNPGFWDVHYGASLTTTLTPSGPRFNQLVEYNPVNPDEIIGDLAESWTVSADGMTYVFRIHDAKWSDGRTVTADDIKFSLDRITLPDAIRGRTAALKRFYEHGTATVTDEKTIEVPIKFPTATFLMNLATDYMKMYARHVVEGQAPEDLNCCPENNIGSGPWIFKEWKRQQSYTYERNPNYFKEGRPFFDGFKFNQIQDTARAIAALQVGQVHGTRYPALSTYQPPDMVQLEKDTGGKMRALVLENAQLGNFMFDIDEPPFEDPRVRRAIYLAIDRQEVVDRVFRGFANPGTFFQPGQVEDLKDLENVPGYRHPKDQDIAEAKRLLADAGFPNGFKGTVNLSNSKIGIAQAEVVTAQLREFLNVDLTISPKDTATFYVELRDGVHPVSLSGGTGVILPDPSDVLSQWFAKDVIRNPHNWSDPEFSQLMAAQEREQDAVKRKELFKEMVEILRKGESHYLPIVWLFAGGALDYRIKNYHAPKTIQLVHKWEHVWFDPDAKIPPVGTGYSP